MLDPLPRVVLVPGLGLFGLGRSKKDASIAADIAETAIERITDAEAIGTFKSISEADMFDCEYWSLEQASSAAARSYRCRTDRGRHRRRRRYRRGNAQLFAAAGAEVALLDVDSTAAREQAGNVAARVDRRMRRDRCSLRDARRSTPSSSAFGGVDIVVSNAGAAWQGRIGEVDEEILRRSFELNFYGHQRVAQAAVKIMLAQGTGGCLLFNVSKQAVNPGPNFGPYGLPKAATLSLTRQYALDYGARRHSRQCGQCRPYPLRAFDADMIASRSKRAGSERKGLYERQSARPRSHGRRCRAGLPASGAGAEDHRGRDHRRRRQYRRRDAVSVQLLDKITFFTIG